jgi:hypothetical protein
MALAGVIVLALGFPMLAMVLLSASGAFSPDLLSTLLIGGVVFTFAILAVFEIMRLVELDGHPAGHAVGHAGAAAGSHHHGVSDAAKAEPARDPVAEKAVEPHPVAAAPAPVASRTPPEIGGPETAPGPVAAAPARPAAPEVAQPIRVEASAPAPAIVVPEEVSIRTAEPPPGPPEAPPAETAQPTATRKAGTKGPPKSQAKSGPKASVAKEAVPTGTAVPAKEAVRASAKSGTKAKSPRSRGPAKA